MSKSSFRSRERKRKRKLALNRDQAKAHASGSSAGRWYLTLVKTPCSCNSCGRRLRRGGEMVYRNTPREIRCHDCAIDQAIKFRPSLAWESARS